MSQQVDGLYAQIDILTRRIEELEAERDKWRTKALDVEKHPVVVTLQRELAEERERLDAILEGSKLTTQGTRSMSAEPFVFPNGNCVWYQRPSGEWWANIKGAYHKFGEDGRAALDAARSKS